MHPVLFKIGPFTIYSLGLFWPLGAFIDAWIVRPAAHPTQLYETCSVAVRFRDTVDSQKKAVFAQNDFLPLFWF